MLSQIADSQEAKKRTVKIGNYLCASHEVLEAFDIDEIDRMQKIVYSTCNYGFMIILKVLKHDGFALLCLQELVKDI